MPSASTFILASASPRRRDLLRRLGVSFEVHPADVDETLDEPDPAAAVEQLARRKARAVAERHPDAVVLGADTLVAVDDDVLGKPADAVEAEAMLRRLSGRRHDVYTGIALCSVDGDLDEAAVERTAVWFGSLTDAEIAEYVAGGSPLDKAGAYGIQDDRGAFFVSRLEGDYYSVMGLPLHRLYQMMKRFAPAVFEHAFARTTAL